MSEFKATYKGVISLIKERPVASGTVKQRNEFFPAKVSFNREEIGTLQQLAQSMSGHGLPPLHIDMLRVSTNQFFMSEQEYEIKENNLYMIYGGLRGCEQKFSPLYEINTSLPAVKVENKMFTPVGFQLTRNGQVVLTVSRYDDRFHVMWNSKSETNFQLVANPIDFSSRLLTGGLLVRESKDEVGDRRVQYAAELIKIAAFNVFDYEPPKSRVFTLPM